MHTLSHVYVEMAQELPVSAWYSPSFMPPRPPGFLVITRLPLSHNSIYHMISPSSCCVKEIPHLSSQSSKFVFHLPAVSEVGGKILFRLCILNCVWILIPTVEGKGPPCCNRCVGSVAARVFMWLGLYCPILCD
jgi:hypothetical protein